MTGAIMKTVSLRTGARALTLVVLLTWLLTGRTAIAQGLPMLPNPITTRELMRFGDRLDQDTVRAAPRTRAPPVEQRPT